MITVVLGEPDARRSEAAGDVARRAAAGQDIVRLAAPGHAGDLPAVIAGTDGVLVVDDLDGWVLDDPAIVDVDLVVAAVASRSEPTVVVTRPAGGDGPLVALNEALARRASATVLVVDGVAVPLPADGR